MNVLHTVRIALLLTPGFLLAQTWTYTPPAYPAVCTNPAVVGVWTMDYATATNRALAEGRNLYLLVTGSTWCPDCDGLQRQVMATPSMQTFMQASDAYWVWLDFPRRNATNATQYGWLCHTNTGLFTLEESERILARNRQLEFTYGSIKNYRSPGTINMPTFVVCRPDGTYQGEVTHYRQWTNVTAATFINSIHRVWNDDAWDVQDNRGRNDDAATTATALTNITETVTRQAHTLSPTDAEDWYAFIAQPGTTYTFAVEGRLLAGQAALPAGQVSVEVFTETNAASASVAATCGALGAKPTVSWTLNQALPSTCYVKVVGTFAEVTGYHLAYRHFMTNAPAGERFGQTLTFSFSGAAAWFFGTAGELWCAPVPAGKNATLKSTVKGPGRLFFDWGFLPAVNAASRLVVKVGNETRTFVAGEAANGSETIHVVKSGTQTVTWQVFADGGQPVAVGLSNVLWQALQKAAVPVPAQNFICTDTPSWLEWDAVPAADEYRVYFGGSRTSLTRLKPEEVVIANSVDPCACMDDCILTTDLNYYWRVDSVMRLPSGGEAVVKGDTWAFKIKSWDGPVTTLPAFNETDGLVVMPGGAYRLVSGVKYELGPFAMTFDCGGCGDEEPDGGDPLTYALVGSLPAGLVMKDLFQETYFSGVPVIPGNYALWVQSDATVEGKHVIGSTYPVAFSVVPLQKAAGQFNGWVRHQDDARLSGSLTLTVSDAGKLSAKALAGGKSYAFSTTGYDAETNGVVYVRMTAPGSKTAAGAGVANTLNLAVSMADGSGTGLLTVYGEIKNDPGAAVVREVVLSRNSWKEAGYAETAAALNGYYTVALPVAAAEDNGPGGSGYVSMTVGTAGSVKLSGVLADGKSWSGSTTLLGTESAGTGSVRVLVFAAPSGYKGAGGLCGLLRFERDDASGNICVAEDAELPLCWWNADGKSVYGYDPLAVGQGFQSEVDACGGYYDKVMNLQTWYLGRSLSFGVFGGGSAAPSGFGGTDDTGAYRLVDVTPQGLQVQVLPQALAVPKKALVYLADGGSPQTIDFGGSVNPCGLTLRYARATGLFDGVFTLYYQDADPATGYKTKAFKYKGILTPVRAKSGPWAACEGQGFYLVPDTGAYQEAGGALKTYRFNGSERLFIESSP